MDLKIHGLAHLLTIFTFADGELDFAELHNHIMELVAEDWGFWGVDWLADLDV